MSRRFYKISTAIFSINLNIILVFVHRGLKSNAAAKKPGMVIGEQNIWAIHKILTFGSFQEPPFCPPWHPTLKALSRVCPSSTVEDQAA